MKKKILIFMTLIMFLPSVNIFALNNYIMPKEEQTHEGTWLTWPHKYTYGEEYRKEIESIWIDIVKALYTGENIHIIAYNNKERDRIEKLLIKNKVDMKKVDFVISKSDDVWVRDTGPIFIFDKNNKLTIVDFAFDG